MSRAYFGSKISKNMTKTPEGFLICKNVPIARTGVQKYLGQELDLKDRYDDIISVYRTEEEVFNPRVMASFEGKPFTEEHPSDWVTPQNASVYMKGTVTNVRRGEGSESDLLLADIIVYHEQQIREINDSEKREVSCGYECEYVEYKDGYKQTNIIGNHVALVTAGRAGNRVAIRDNKNQVSNNERRNRNMTAENGYKLPRRQKAKDFLYGIGLKHFAMDADPEDMAEAVDELVNEKLEEEKAAEPVVINKEEGAKDNQGDEKNDLDATKILDEISMLKDTISGLLSSGVGSEVKDEEEFEEPDGTEALDELEDELDKAEDDDAEEVESAEVDPAEINESEGAEEVKATDSIKELARVMKMVVAGIPDAKQRKQTSDALAKVLRKHAEDAKSQNKGAYGAMASRTKDNSAEQPQEDIGMKIAKQYNPHYKEK